MLSKRGVGPKLHIGCVTRERCGSQTAHGVCN
ncbi:hypothetical protein NC653_027810 [Populus alba x Populus x berolinensis]|uniref:Uncharacterized protein n=1 Tax=Populus alba x Populus x berolinensis TaxID=444605 RepID=A0AAD6Q5H6_9ROSI|nr:hypothetical protein NC653_027810 [Populus alba x Populus x berolinensis]